MKKKQTFEEALQRLTEIAQLLEQGNTPLEESLKLYEEGAGLSAFCAQSLKDARQRITELSADIAEEE